MMMWMILLSLESSHFSQRKSQTKAKPRPVVVKLDEGDEVHIEAKKPDSKDDLISGAV